jgi:trans-AT polyketide synthase, acyltransferase and oxidoreductase domains
MLKDTKIPTNPALAQLESPDQPWNHDWIALDEAEIRARLLNLQHPCYLLRVNGKLGVANQLLPTSESIETLMTAPPIAPSQFGDRQFRAFHGVNYAYMAELPLKAW